MTACVNKKSKRVAAVVTASLVGALSIGAPAVALGAEVSMLEATETTALRDGSIVSFVDADDKAAEAGATFVANGEAQGIKPKKVQPWGTTAAEAQKDVTEIVVYKIVGKGTSGAKEETGLTLDGKSFYYDSNFGTAGKSGELPKAIGNYAVFAKVGDTQVKAGAKFSIVSAKLDDATLYQIDSADTDDVTDTSYVFNNGSWRFTPKSPNQYDQIADANRFGLAVGDTQLDTSKFSYEYYTAKGAKVEPNDIVAAGDYYAIVSGNPGSEYAGQKKRFDFTISPFDLSKADVVVNDVQWKGQGGDVTTSVVSVDSITYNNSWIDTFTTVDYPNVATGLGKASLTLNVDETALAANGYAGSVINSQTVSYNVVAAIVDPVAKYADEAFDSYNTGNPYKVDFSATPSNAFDSSKVKVSYTNPETGESVNTDKYTLRVVNTETHEVGGVEMLSSKGTYTVQAILDSEALSWAVAGKSDEMTVEVTKGVIANADVAFALDGKTITGDISGVEYLPGADLMSRLTVSVKTSNGEVPSSDYKVVVTKKDGTQWNEVKEVIDAGTYKVSVVADGYSYDKDDASITVTISPRDLSGQNLKVRVANTFNYVDNNEKEHRVLPYTGDVIVASYEWSIDGKTWYELPASDYDVAYTQDSQKVELKEAGTYTASVSASSKSVNYTNSATTWPEVSDKKVFLDVPADEWFSKSVYTARELKYIKGYNGTKLFGPNDMIKRGDVAIVLFNMAGGGQEGNVSSDMKLDFVSFGTKFSDVEADDYYAEAIGWAVKTGVVNGRPDGTFAPDEFVTRQDFACMLANYAEKTGVDVKSATSEVLEGLEGAGEVAAYAKDALEWATASKLMGKDGRVRANDTISRAEVAAMAVDFQPNGADSSLL